jgi:adenylate cyclase, class 2
MKTEYEAKFTNISKDQIRNRLKKMGAKLVRPEFFQKRVAFNLPKRSIKKGYLRVRDEGDKVTMSLKFVNGKKIEDQKEVLLKVDNFEYAVEFLRLIGCNQKALQHTKRELWSFDGVEITIDEWPFLEPFIEIEGASEAKVRSVSEKLGFDYKNAVFGAVDELYNQKYGISKNIINNHTPEITFSSNNPFVQH